MTKYDELLQIDDSITMEGGWHPIHFISGKFTGVSFAIIDIKIDGGKISYGYSIVRGKIEDEDVKEFEQTLQDYIYYKILEQAINDQT
jgi:hypothetical protein